jgi:hypothetical protein
MPKRGNNNNFTQLPLTHHPTHRILSISTPFPDHYVQWNPELLVTRARQKGTCRNGGNSKRLAPKAQFSQKRYWPLDGSCWYFFSPFIPITTPCNFFFLFFSFFLSPGGPKMLEYFENEFGLNKGKLKHCWTTLNEVGNVSYFHYSFFFLIFFLSFYIYIYIYIK